MAFLLKNSPFSILHSQLSCDRVFSLYNASTMPRGKRTVFGLFCADPECPQVGQRLGTMRFHKQDKLGKSYKDHVASMMKYCPAIRKRVALRWKEERHSK